MEEQGKGKKIGRQKYFVARELQLSIALLVIVALMGGIFLRYLATALTEYLEFETSILSILLVIGYVIIIGFLAIVFSHRLVGPFKRLEYEMRHVKVGELDKRLTVRTKDDLHVRNFVEQVNDMIGSFEDMSRAYNKLNSAISTGLARVVEDMNQEDFDCEKLKEELKDLQREIHKHRERW